MLQYKLDFDGKPLELVESAFKTSQNYQQARNRQYSNNNKLYHGMMDVIDPDRANIFIPMIHNIVEVKAPRYVRAAHGVRPYIPFEATRPDFREVARLQARFLDELLHKAQFLNRRILALKSVILHGTAFMESVPYFELVTEKVLVPDMFGRPQMQQRQVPRLRFRLKVFAPWEVYVDPFATGLESADECRWVVKQELASRRAILRLAQKGGYPGLDIEKLANEDENLMGRHDHWGSQMLGDLGLSLPKTDGDVGVLLRYESPERYIELWNGHTILRDIPNPYAHKQINLSRMVHGMNPHTQDAFWGIGDAKMNEVLQMMLNDTWNMTFDSHFMMNQPMIYYRQGKVDPNALVRTSGNRVAIDSTSDERPITHDFYESSGNPLPRDHYDIPFTIEKMIEKTSGASDMIQGIDSSRESTASEAAMRKEAGELRLELAVRQDEVFLSDFGRKCLSHIDQFATFDDFVEVLGPQDAQLLYTANPADLPGGYNFTFKGADKIANQVVAQRNLQAIAPHILQLPTLLPTRFGHWVLEQFNVDDQRAREMFIPDEAFFQMQAEQAQADREFELMKMRMDLEGDLQRDEQKGRQQQQQRQRPVSKQRKSSGGVGGGDEEASARTYTRVN